MTDLSSKHPEKCDVHHTFVLYRERWSNNSQYHSVIIKTKEIHHNLLIIISFHELSIEQDDSYYQQTNCKDSL